MLRSPLSKLSLLVIPALLAGCPDPDGAFDAYEERRQEFIDNPPKVVADAEPQPDMDLTMDMLVGPPDITGRYLFALATALDPSKPLLFDTDLAVDLMADPPTIQLTLLGLQQWCEGAFCDSMAPERLTEVPPAIEPAAVNIASDNTFEIDFGEVTLGAPANPISGSPIVAELRIFGELRPDGICGQFEGRLIMPFEFGLDRSANNFGTAPVPDGGDIKMVQPLGQCF